VIDIDYADIRAWHDGAYFASKDLVYPTTIIPARYGGVYEGGKWLAFPFWHGNLTSEECDDLDGGDCECAEWWLAHALHPIGKGATPQAAYDNMLEKLRKGPPAHTGEQ
jgi:hypothetical protein